MSNIIQNVKSGFANIKELFEIILSDDIDNEGYDLYINSSDKNIVETAQMLKQLEEEQESRRFFLLSPNKSKKVTKKIFKSDIKKTDTSQNIISSDVNLLDNIEPEK